MFFCEKCGYTFDITGNVKRKQVGGKINTSVINIFKKFQNSEPFTKEDLEKISDGDILHNEKFESMTKKKQNQLRSAINSIDKTFFKSQKQKDAQAALAVEEEKDGSDTNDNMIPLANFICRFCENSKPIEPGTLLYSRKYGADADDSVDYGFMVNDPSLARTKVYTCINKKCETHSNPSIKEAVITKNSSHRVIYVCVHCKHWSTG